MAIAVTFPGLALGNHIRPFVFGIPFAFAWVLAWVAGSIPILYFLHRSLTK